MIQKPALGFDLDGVIIDHTSNKLRHAKALGYDLSPAETASGVMKKHVHPDHYREIKHTIYGSASLEAPPMEGALEMIAELAPAFRIFIISRRNMRDGFDEWGRQWLDVHGVHRSIPREQVFFVAHDVVGAKDAVARQHGIRAYMDDQAKILYELPSVSVRILFDPFDVGEISEPLVKIKKWQELPAIVETVR